MRPTITILVVMLVAIKVSYEGGKLDKAAGKPLSFGDFYYLEEEEFGFLSIEKNKDIDFRP